MKLTIQNGMNKSRPLSPAARKQFKNYWGRKGDLRRQKVQNSSKSIDASLKGQLYRQLESSLTTGNEDRGRAPNSLWPEFWRDRCPIFSLLLRTARSWDYECNRQIRRVRKWKWILTPLAPLVKVRGLSSWSILFAGFGYLFQDLDLCEGFL